MRPHAIATIGIALGCAAMPARADWRDGCPTGTRDPTRPTERHATGAPPQLDATITPSRVTLDVEGAYSTPSDNAGVAVPRRRAVGAAVRAQHSFAVPWVTRPVVHRFTASATLAQLLAASGDDQPAGDTPPTTGALTVTLGYRYSRADTLDIGNGEPTLPTIAGSRSGLAIEAIGAVPLDRAQEMQPVAARLPFDPALFAAAGALGVAGEYRTEETGCAAPFFHTRTSAVYLRDPADRDPALPRGPSVAVTSTAAVGLYLAAHHAAFAQYGLSVRYPRDLLQRPVVHRLRLGWEASFDAIAVGAHLDVFTGSFDGVFVGAHLSWLFFTPRIGRASR